MRKKTWISSIIIILIATIGIVMIKCKDSRYDEDISKIKSSVIAGEQLSSSDFDGKLNSINAKLNDGQDITAEEYFILGYSQYINNEYEEADASFLLCNEKVNKKTNPFIRFYLADYFSEQNINNGNYDEAINIVKELFAEDIDSLDLNSNYQMVAPVCEEILYLPEGRDIILNIYKDIMEEKSSLSDEVVVTLRSSQIVLYTLTGNYSDGIEAALSNVALAGNYRQLAYYEAKSLVDMGIIFATLSNDAESIKIIERSFNVKIDDNVKRNIIRVYGTINLLDIYSSTGDYDLFMDYYNSINDYYEGLDEYEIKSIEYSKKLCLANLYLSLDEIEKAKDVMEEIELEIVENDENIFLDGDVFYNVINGRLLLVDGKVEEAIDVLLNCLELIEVKGNYQYNKVVLNSLADAYAANGDSEKRAEYLQSLIEQSQEENAVINDDYTSYVINKYQYELQLNKLSTTKSQRFIIGIMITFFVAIIIIVVYFRYEKLIKINKMDPLTHAFNRGEFDIQYNKLLQERKKFFLIIFDIDDFKKFNDTFGHVFADKVLIELVKITEKTLSSKGNLYRYGGEEFVVLMKNSTRSEAVDMAEKVRSNIEEKKWPDDIKVTVSLGIAESNDGYIDVLEEADRRLYISKKTGKNKVTY